MTAPHRPDEWRRLHPRTIAANSIIAGGALAVAGIPMVTAMALNGLGIGWILLWTIGGLILGVAGTAGIEAVRLSVTRFRVDEHRIDRRVRFLASTTTSVATARVRNVEIATNPVQRRLDLATVRLSSGETDGSRLTLASLDRTAAEDLRRHLLSGRAAEDSAEISRVNPGWVRYAPASLLTPVFGATAIGVMFQVADWFNAVPAMLEWVRDAIDDVPVPLLVVGALLLLLAAGSAITAAVFVENWWAMRLDHHRDGSLEQRRGLLVGRHTTYDGSRIRGVTLHEPPGFRALRAARLDVIAIGVGTGNDENGKPKPSPALIPGSPRRVSVDVAGAVLSTQPPGITSPARLRPHPPAARRRRYLRAALATAAITVIALVPALVWPWLWWLPVTVAIVSGTVAAWVAVDNSRGLGHAVEDAHVALRKGSLLRRTDVLTRDGLLGWNLRRTPFQRRAGLVTMVATSAGGNGAFRLPDVAASDAPDLWPTAGDVWDHLTIDPPAGPTH